MEAFDAVHTADEPGPLKGLCTIVMPEAHLKEFAFQHAVELNSENYPLALEQSSEEPPDPQTLAAAMETFRRWPKGMRLRVHFMEGDPVVHRRIEEIALEWCQYANVEFRFGAGPDAEIRIAFNPHWGSWSYMGTDCSLPQLAGRPTMNLGWLTPTTTEVEYRRVVLHEFGHALGLVHEHLSPAAEIPWDEKKVIAYYKRTNGWNEDYIRANVLARSKADAFTRFDPLSIMLYPVPKELTIGGFEIPWSNSELSALDREFIAQMYPFSDGRSSAAKAG